MHVWDGLLPRLGFALKKLFASFCVNWGDKPHTMACFQQSQWFLLLCIIHFSWKLIWCLKRCSLLVCTAELCPRDMQAVPVLYPEFHTQVSGRWVLRRGLYLSSQALAEELLRWVTLVLPAPGPARLACRKPVRLFACSLPLEVAFCFPFLFFFCRLVLCPVPWSSLQIALSSLDCISFVVSGSSWNRSVAQRPNTCRKFDWLW